MWFSDLRIILASQSPRRAQLLREMGVPFVIRPQAVPEDYPPHLPVDEVAPFLARKKARAAAGLLESERDVLLTADSTVILDDTILDKPAGREEAMHTLRRLSDRTHRVVTGVCLKSFRRERLFAAVSKVTFAALQEAEIEYYVDHFQPYDKAGAYAIQEWIGLCKVSAIEGTYSNIVGLPVESVYRELQRLVEP